MTTCVRVRVCTNAFESATENLMHHRVQVLVIRRLFPCTTLSDWFLKFVKCVKCVPQNNDMNIPAGYKVYNKTIRLISFTLSLLRCAAKTPESVARYPYDLPLHVHSQKSCVCR
jgi:hypothetical protein